MPGPAGWTRTQSDRYPGPLATATEAAARGGPALSHTVTACGPPLAGVWPAAAGATGPGHCGIITVPCKLFKGRRGQRQRGPLAGRPQLASDAALKALPGGRRRLPGPMGPPGRRRADMTQVYFSPSFRLQ
jgi:hypothetical protein